jgi:hypothetical protein
MGHSICANVCVTGNSSADDPEQRTRTIREGISHKTTEIARKGRWSMRFPDAKSQCLLAFREMTHSSSSVDREAEQRDPTFHEIFCPESIRYYFLNAIAPHFAILSFQSQTKSTDWSHLCDKFYDMTLNAPQGHAKWHHFAGNWTQKKQLHQTRSHKGKISKRVFNGDHLWIGLTGFTPLNVENRSWHDCRVNSLRMKYDHCLFATQIFLGSGTCLCEPIAILCPRFGLLWMTARTFLEDFRKLFQWNVIGSYKSWRKDLMSLYAPSRSDSASCSIYKSKLQFLSWCSSTGCSFSSSPFPVDHPRMGWRRVAPSDAFTNMIYLYADFFPEDRSSIWCWFDECWSMSICFEMVRETAIRTQLISTQLWRWLSHFHWRACVCVSESSRNWLVPAQGAQDDRTRDGIM